MMPKGKKTDPMDTVAWVKKLPNEGGAWGQGVVGTIIECDQKIAQIDDQMKALSVQMDQFKAAKKDQVKLQRSTAKRAEKEASTLYANSQIQSAKNEALADATAEQAKDEPKDDPKADTKSKTKGKSQQATA
jgi:hypothetical protein